MATNRFEVYLAKVLKEYGMVAESVDPQAEGWPVEDAYAHGWFRLVESGQILVLAGPAFDGEWPGIDLAVDRALVRIGSGKVGVVVYPGGEFTVRPHLNRLSDDLLVGCPRCGVYHFSPSASSGCGHCGGPVVIQAARFLPWWGFLGKVHISMETVPMAKRFKKPFQVTAAAWDDPSVTASEHRPGVLFNDAEADAVKDRDGGAWQDLRRRLSGEPRTIGWPDRPVLERFLAGYPNFREVSTLLVQTLELSRFRPKSGISFPPLLLVGHPGCGKTSFAERLAQLLVGHDFLRLDLGHGTANLALVGNDAAFKQAKPGRILGALVGREKMGPVRNPVVILDEIDKIPRDSQFDPLPALLGLLEPRDAQRFTDEFFAVPIDASGIQYVALANNLHKIPGPLLSRFLVFQIPDCTEAEFTAVVIPRIYDQWRTCFHEGTFPESLPTETRSRIAGEAGFSARQVRSVLDRWAASALEDLAPKPTFESLQTEWSV